MKKYCVDPVCGKRIDPVKSGIAAVHDGCAYYFCSPQCWAAFQDAPTLYRRSPSPMSKGWWGRYLKRVEKTTEGEPTCCN